MSAPNVADEHAVLVTVAMPVFNAGHQLRLALRSIVQQSFSDWELLLIDDGSTDGAVQAVADIDDSRIRVICDGQNRGLAARLNEAIDLARGQYFARMDQDDVSHPDRLARQVASLQAAPSVDLVGTRCLTISEGNRILGIFPGQERHEDICRRPWLGFYLPHPTWMGRTAWFRQHRYASPGPYCCEDQEMLLRTHTLGRFQVLPELLLAYRLRDRLNLKKAWRTRLSLFRVQRRYFVSRAQYRQAALAAAACCLRIAKDCAAALRQYAGGTAVLRSEDVALSETDAAAWRRIIRHLEQNA